MTYKHEKWLQILAQEHFPLKLLWSENADFRFSVNNEEQEVNKKPRGAEETLLRTEKATPTTTDRGTGDWNQTHYERFNSLSKTQIS